MAALGSLLSLAPMLGSPASPGPRTQLDLEGQSQEGLPVTSWGPRETKHTHEEHLSLWEPDLKKQVLGVPESMDWELRWTPKFVRSQGLFCKARTRQTTTVRGNSHQLSAGLTHTELRYHRNCG